MSTVVIHHGGGCRDGFCAAWLMNLAFDDVAFVPAQYGDEPPYVKDQDVFILDFSYPPDVLQHLCDDAKSVVLLDHHKTAVETLDDFRHAKLRKTVDTTKSGARLTHDYLRDEGLIDYNTWLVDYTEDRDLWRWRLPYSREIDAVLGSYPLDFEVWSLLAARNPETLVEQGVAILRFKKQVVDEHVKRAGSMVLGGYRVPYVNATMFQSEIAGALAEGHPFGVCYFDKDDGLREFSLRSRKGGVDVSEVAKKYGGGGHANAAGFRKVYDVT